MILQDEKVNVTTSQQFESKQMSISPEFFNKMIWHVILQYKYKIRTSVQELISNAIDAQVEAGNKDKPLKIQLPTRLEPTFKLRDYGTGMTPEIMDKIYRNMGASGSSHTNDKKGGFGIGGKSPLGFSDQYNIKTYVDGKFWFYVVYKNEQNGINVDLLQTGNTNEPNGTEIQIPAKSDQIRKFTEAACRATMFWDIQPEFNLESDHLYKANNENKISKHVSLYNHQSLGNLFRPSYNSELVLIVDGIPYIIDSEIVRKVKPLKTLNDMLKDDSVLTIRVNNGDIKILQTRESLEDCDYTINQLEKIGAIALNDVTKYIEKQTKKATVLDTANALIELKSQFNNVPTITMNGFSINGHTLSLQCKSKVGLIEYHYKGKGYRSVLQNAKREYELNDYLRLNEIDKIYLDDLGDKESKILKSRRIKHFISSDKSNAFYIDTETTDQNTINLLTKNFNFKLLSSLPLPPKTAKVSYSSNKVLDKGEIDVHTLAESTSWNAARSWGSKQIVRTVNTIDLNTNGTKYIWADYFDYDNKIMQNQWVDFMKSLGFTPCLISKKYQSKIKGDKNFITFEKWLKDLKLKDSQINGIINNEISLETKDILLAKASLNSKDKTLKQYAQHLVFNKDSVSQLPRELKERVLKENKSKISLIKKNRDFFNRAIKSKYNLLNKVNINQLSEKEATDYINLAYRR